MGGRRVRMMDRKIEGEGNERVDERMGKGINIDGRSQRGEEGNSFFLKRTRR